MTIADPYPATLAEIDEAPIHVNSDAQLARLVATLNRVAQALEQHTLALLDRPQPAQNAPGAALATLPPVQMQTQSAGVPMGVCPIHGTPWKVVPAGVSAKTGKAYEAFRACSTRGCDQRPPR